MTSKVHEYEKSILLRENDNGEPAQDIRNNEDSSQMNVAERDIVNDSRPNMFLIHLCEELASNVEIDCSRYSISRLKGLRSLNLASCESVTDVSLKYALDFLELEQLSLSKCQKITAAGFEGFALKCPSIKVLNLSDCHNLCDRAINIVSVHLKRLKFLHIERCSQLTDASLDSILLHCKNLKYLDVRGCHSMCSELSLKLEPLTSLLQILRSKPGPYMGKPSPYKSIPIPPPPPAPF